jgi:glycosyltransferase involved in cell wall biosynthesis
MKVLIVNQYAYAPFHHGGTRHYMLARELLARGHRVRIISTSFFHKSQEETRLKPGQPYLLEEIDGVEFLWLRTPPYRGNGVGRVRNMLSYAWQVWREAGPSARFLPEVIYSSSPHLFAGLAAHKLSRRLNVPHVLEIRDLWPQTFVDLGNWSAGHPWIRLLDRVQRHLYRHADQVISTLPAAAPYITAHGGREDRVTWITNGISPSLLPPPTPLRTAPTPFVFMHAGVHAVSTGLDLIIEAAHLLHKQGLGDNIRVVLLGNGPEKSRQQELAKSLGLSNVEFWDPVPKHQVFDKLAMADGFLLPRKPSPIHQWGISPHKLADYFAARRPVVFCVDSPWNPVEAERAGLTAEPGNPASLADAMARLAASSQEEREAMARRGYDYMTRELDIAHLGRKLEDVLLRATGN